MLILNWLEIHIDTNHAGLEAVEAMLSSLDVDGVVIDDETEFREFLEDNRQYWDYVDEDLERRMEGLSRVTFYLQADEECPGGAAGDAAGLRQPHHVPEQPGGRGLGEQLEAVL